MQPYENRETASNCQLIIEDSFSIAELQQNDIIEPLCDSDDDTAAISSGAQCRGEIESLLETNQLPLDESAEEVGWNERPKLGPSRRKRKRKSSMSVSEVLTEAEDMADDDFKDENNPPQPKQLKRNIESKGTPIKKPKGKAFL